MSKAVLIFHKNLVNLFKRKSPSNEPSASKGCPRCALSSPIDFFIWSKSVFKESINKIKDLKYSEELFQCKECEAFWLLQGDHMKFVENIELLLAWHEKAHLCPENLLETLHGIGPTNFLTIPAAATTVKGEFLPVCEVHFLDESPVWLDQSKRIILINEIENFQLSEYALPQKIRQKTSEAWELRMGFAPTAIQSEDGQVYLLHGIKHFFCQDGLKGADFKVLMQEYVENKTKEAEYSGPAPVIIIAELEPKLLHW